MTHEKEGKAKSGKKVAAKSLKEKRAAKVAKRKEKASISSIKLNPLNKSK